MPHRALSLLLTFEDQLRRDEAQSPAFLHRRDRNFALARQAEGKTTEVRDWLAHLQRFNGPESKPANDRRLIRWQHINAGFALLGLLLGSLTMAGLMFYDGRGRINLTVIIAVVLVQAVLAVFTTVQALAGWQPWRWLTRQLALADAGGTSGLRPLHPQLMARAAHLGGLCFGLSGLATLLVLVTVKDLAFGWSTTLNAGAESFYSLARALAWPWHALWAEAAPTLELVSQTRFYRATGGYHHTDPQLWGAWWPFVTMLWFAYVVVPRLLLLWFAGGHLHYRAGQLLQRHPGRMALYERMATPTLDTGSTREEVTTAPDLATATRLRPRPATCHAVVLWAGADPRSPGRALPDSQGPVVSAGGAASLADDHHALQAVARHVHPLAHPEVGLFTRAWEPPTAELADFLEQARTLWPKHTRINLMPLAADPSTPPPPHQLAQWLRFAERQRDPGVIICAGVGP
ncbi:DUF2868 domain-containing protein [Marinobacter sp. X15-166B]|uniref:DUF2868 domain-containing protein n=1 Tax=Marinobacter sp. X15-166B TaxID=1897620 RepID=UPI00085C7167|nr:DUF2868 domain-containing protein [Marinobacter sp. X15-166B]OEY66173.1 hypothetical protein BG841_06675 [Marinobacter sp. X15-166B]